MTKDNISNNSNKNSKNKKDNKKENNVKKTYQEHTKPIDRGFVPERSPKQLSIERKILKKLTGEPKRLAQMLFADDELQVLQDYANSVSITRLAMNDHGPVHMRIAMLNSISIFELLVKAGVEPSLVAEGYGNVEDSLMAVMLGTFLHDLGMTIGRANHEKMSAILAQDHIKRVLSNFYSNPLQLAVMNSIVTECIVGHMATQKISSIEAGIVLISDGCDMIGGRARISMQIATEAHVGDIHRYSAYSITGVEIIPGTEKPVRIQVSMNESAGFFQVEQVLMPKVSASPVKSFIELYAKWGKREPMRYL
jgi:metal-dependent HD superfamily phosphatase/phosphodiesterase